MRVLHYNLIFLNKLNQQNFYCLFVFLIFNFFNQNSGQKKPRFQKILNPYRSGMMTAVIWPSYTKGSHKFNYVNMFHIMNSSLFRAVMAF